MTKNCFRMLLVFVLSLAAVPVSAAPTLLAYFIDSTYTFGGDPNTIPRQSNTFSFSAINPHGLVYLSWEQEVTFADIGQRFFAPPEMVEGAQAALASPTAVYTIQTTDEGEPVGSLGIKNPIANLSQYRVTALERVVVDYFHERVIPNDIGSGYVIGGTQHILFWGTPIPEPAAFAILLLGACHIVGLRARQRRVVL